MQYCRQLSASKVTEIRLMLLFIIFVSTSCLQKSTFVGPEALLECMLWGSSESTEVLQKPDSEQPCQDRHEVAYISRPQLTKIWYGEGQEKHDCWTTTNPSRSQFK